MKKFEFAKNELLIEIGDNKYSCDPAATLAAVTAAHKELSVFNDKLNCGDVLNNEIERVMGVLVAHIDVALAPGATNAIFKERKVCLHDICDVLIYIKACCLDFEARKQEQYRNTLNVLADKR